MNFPTIATELINNLRAEYKDVGPLTLIICEKLFIAIQDDLAKHKQYKNSITFLKPHVISFSTVAGEIKLINRDSLREIGVML